MADTQYEERNGAGFIFSGLLLCISECENRINADYDTQADVYFCGVHHFN